MSDKPRILLGVTGASGAPYVPALLRRRIGDTWLVLSNWGRMVMKEETGLTEDELRPFVRDIFSDKDLANPFASGSNVFDAMVVMPCSLSTLAKIAHGLADSLITRAALVALKERRRLILVVREAPWPTNALENAARLSRDGVIIIPASPPFYHGPESLEDLIEHFVDKVAGTLGEPGPRVWRPEALDAGQGASPDMAYSDQRSFLKALESAGELRRVTQEVDPRLEITEIADRIVKRRGPALLFENVKGSSIPLLINPLGSERRIEMALGRPPAEIGDRLLELAQKANPPSPRALWGVRGTLWELLSMRTRSVRRAPVQEVVEEPRLSDLPVQTAWPGDGGPFITFGLVVTRDPVTGERNMGLYRVQVFDDRTTGMHWQINKGGGFHYARAEAEGRPLEVAVVLGADPALLISAIAALPEGMDEIAFSGLLRGAPCPMVPCKSIGLEVPANAEIVLEGVVPPHERRLEGPFGDHFGHYSHAADFPIFQVRRVTRRRAPIYLSAIVGLPPQEDKYIGNATQEILGPLIKVIHHEIGEVWAYFEAGFHNLLVVSVRQRFYKEAVKTALALMGTGQLALTKCLVLVDETVDVRDFDAVVRSIGEHFDPQRDFLMMPGVPLDTLDFTSFRMNLGSKMVIDATSGPSDDLHGAPGADREAVLAAIRAARAEPHADALSPAADYAAGDPPPVGTRNTRAPDPRELDSRVRDFRVVQETLMVVTVEQQGREVIESLIRHDLGPVKICAAVSPDVDLDDRDLLLWGIFTRFDCARDVAFTTVRQRGIWSTCYGVMGIDATFKAGYPDRLQMPEEVVERVDRMWPDLGLD